MEYNGKIISIAYPDTFVNMSTEFMCKVLPMVGLGTKDYIKAGHAALILVSNDTEMAYYYDFGRYITPNGKGRVRGALTDSELEIPFRASFDKDGTLTNLDDFLMWLNDNPHKTHGEGRLVASVCEDINFEAAQHYILNLQRKGSIPYGAFDKRGSNCSRFVTDTILFATKNRRIKLGLGFNKLFTPSPLGNVQKAATIGKMFSVEKGHISVYSRSVVVENLTNYFHKKSDDIELGQVEKHPLPANAQYLPGIGCGAYFTLARTRKKYEYRIQKFDDYGHLDHDGVFEVNDADFNENHFYQFMYDSNCQYCHVKQDGYIFQFNFLRKTAVKKEKVVASLQQKERLA
ncbi:DUF6695 family protein [Spongiivirga citrea]|uniref:Uncharacterized protein n=1 Tax=Spongiivirga citrea TaxID=1481457 RepID=A0A6M0CL27_9FLAO|nr:DUF6695 family protein [Spongiivirga citrea]NER18636.1 hypothetical protein [Spongiivirga citrea]